MDTIISNLIKNDKNIAFIDICIVDVAHFHPMLYCQMH